MIYDREEIGEDSYLHLDLATGDDAAFVKRMHDVLPLPEGYLGEALRLVGNDRNKLAQLMNVFSSTGCYPSMLLLRMMLRR